jgi:hypothetical protein
VKRSTAFIAAVVLFVLTILSLPRLYNVLYAIRWVPPRKTVAPIRVPAEEVPEEEKAPKFKFYTGKSGIVP